MNNKKLDFRYGYEVRDVSPLPHYYEEIISHTKQLKTIGLRGDHNYMFYSKNKHGTAYYEQAEAGLAAEYTYTYFSDSANQKKFFGSADKLLQEVANKLEDVGRYELDQLSDRQLRDTYTQLIGLDGWIFTYFLATQPYKTKLFEDEVRHELRKRVASSRVDEYLTELALSEQPTRMSQEEKDWLALIIESRKKLSPASLDLKNLQKKHPELYDRVAAHYQMYKILSLGDGAWKHSIDYFISNLSRDYGRPINELKDRYAQLNNFKAETLARRQKLIEELYLEPAAVNTVNFLARVGHYRLVLRIDGFIPLIYMCNVILRKIESRLGVTGDEVMYILDDTELKDFFNNPSQEKLNQLRKRVSKNHEYLLLLLNGKYSAYFGDDAAKMFKKYVQTQDLSKDTQVSGSVAMRGKVRATATVYMWGDDLNASLKDIKKHPILIAGHTRPAMMPLIRESLGIVTDEGGITSHAAIVSRELGLPSVINTKIATKVFKTGDLVELDGETGTVTKL